METYEKAKVFYSKKFASQHEQIIKELTTLRDEIQADVRWQKEVGSILSFEGAVSGFLVLGGLALSPFCFAIGTASGIVCAGLDLLNKVNAELSVDAKLEEAKESLKDYEINLKKMYEYLEEIYRYKRTVERYIIDIEQQPSKNDEIVEKSVELAEIIVNLALNVKQVNEHTFISEGWEIYEFLKIQGPWKKVMSNARRFANEAVQGAAKEAVTGAAQGAATEVAKGVAKEAGKRATHGAVKGAAQGTAKSAAHGAAKGAAQGAAQGAAKGAAKKITNVSSRRVVKLGAKKVAEETAATSTKIIGTAAVLGILIDLKSLYDNQKDIAKFNKGKLCEQAKRLSRAIEDLKDEFEPISKVFEKHNLP